MICKHWVREQDGTLGRARVERCELGRWGQRPSACGLDCEDADRRQLGVDWTWRASLRNSTDEFCQSCSRSARTSEDDLLAVPVLLNDIANYAIIDIMRASHPRVFSMRRDRPAMARQCEDITRIYEAATEQGPHNGAEGYLRHAHAAFRDRWENVFVTIENALGI